MLSQIESLLPQPDLSFGVGGIAFFSPASLSEEQLGYEAPDWRGSWVVVARETTCGDPIFVDQSQTQLPVYTAMHGMGSWKPWPVADSWRQFLAALEFIRPHTAGREHPAGLEQHPLTSAERQSLQDGLRAILGSPVPNFWDLLLAPAEP